MFLTQQIECVHPTRRSLQGRSRPQEVELDIPGPAGSTLTEGPVIAKNMEKCFLLLFGASTQSPEQWWSQAAQALTKESLGKPDEIEGAAHYAFFFE